MWDPFSRFHCAVKEVSHLDRLDDASMLAGVLMTKMDYDS
jgi:hypothetical protein